MPFREARKIVDRETKKEGIEISGKEAKEQLKKAKSTLSTYANRTADYLKKLTYEGHQTDRANYIRAVKKELAEVLKDKTATKKELLKFRRTLSSRSERFRKRTVEQQRAHEELKFRKLKEKTSESIIRGNFDEAIDRYKKLRISLTILNRTSEGGNIEERHLRLDLRIDEEINALKNLSKLYKAKYKPDNAFISDKAKYYIHGVDKGIIVFSSLIGVETEKGPKFKMGKRQKMSWLKFKKLTEKQKCKIKKYNEGNFANLDDVEADKEVVNSRAKIEELKRLKEINHIFSGKILDSIKDPRQKELMEKGIEEHYNSMRLYFEKDNKGIVRPTEVYNSLSVENRVKILVKMISGLNSAIEKFKLKETIEKEKDPIKKMFYKAEMALKSGDNMQAYAHYKAFKKKTELWGYKKYQKQFSKLARNWDLPGAIKIAEKRLRQLSFKLINTAEKYVSAAIQQKAHGLFISGDVAKKTYKETMQVLNGMRKALKSGDAYDVSTAWQKVGLPWYRARQDRMKGLKPSELGRSETQLRVFHMPMIIKLTEIALITNKKEQKKKLLTLADDARKTNFRAAASVLYKEYMQDDLHKYEKKKMKTKKYWAEKRKTYMEIKNSTNPFVTAFRDNAKEIAKNAIGKEKFAKLSDKEKKVLIKRYEHRLIEQNVNKGATKDLFKDFLKSAEGGNKAAAKYIDMEDPFDEWFNLSDAGKDTVKEFAGEAIILGCSGGLGNLAGRGVTAGLRTLAKKSAEKLAVRLATAGAGIAVDLVVSEVIDRGLRTVLMGQKGLFSEKELMNALKHAVATYGVLSLGSRVGGFALEKLENISQLTKYTARVGQAVALEAPLMALLNHGFSGWEGNWLDHYGQSMMTILASRAGMKLWHGSTDNMLIKAEHAMAFKARLHSLKATQPAKGALIEGMLKSGDVPKESIVQLMNADLSVSEMKKLSKYMNDPKNAGFLLAIKYAQEHGEMTKQIKEQYQGYLLDLRLMGFTKAKAVKFAKSMSLQGLLSKYGERGNKIAKEQLDTAIKEQKIAEAKQWMKDNLGKIKRWLKNPNIKEAFVTYIEKAQGNYAKFLQKYPKLAKIMPKDLTKLKVIPRFNPNRLGSTFGSMSLDSASDMRKKAKREKETAVLSNKKNKKAAAKPVKPADTIDRNNKMAMKELSDLKSELEKIGLHKIAEEIADPESAFLPSTGQEIKTLIQRKKIVEELKVLHQEIQFRADHLRTLGLGKEVKELTNYSDTSKYRSLQERIDEMNRLERLVDDIGDISNYLRQNGLVKEATELSNLNDRSIYQTFDQRIDKAQYLYGEIHNLRKWGIEFNKNNAADIIALINGKSDHGLELKKMMTLYAGLEFKPNSELQEVYLDKRMQTKIKEWLPNSSESTINRIIEATKHKFDLSGIKPEDKLILKANPHLITPEVIQSMIAGGVEMTYQGKTIKVYTGRKLGEGGIAKVKEIWYVEKGKTELNNAVIKTIKTENELYATYFIYEGQNINELKAALTGKSVNHISGLIVGGDKFMIYSKVSDKNGESRDLGKNDSRNIPPNEQMRYLADSFLGLSETHAAGFTHGDYKPENIVIGTRKTQKGKINAGELIDFGSAINNNNIINAANPEGIITTINIQIEGRTFEVPAIKKGDDNYPMPFTPQYHNPNLMADAVKGKVPFNAGDKYAAGTTLMAKLEEFGHVTKDKPGDDFDHSYSLKPNASESAKKLFAIAQKLQNVRNHPYEFMNNNEANGKDPQYISLTEAARQIRNITL